MICYISTNYQGPGVAMVGFDTAAADDGIDARFRRAIRQLEELLASDDWRAMSLEGNLLDRSPQLLSRVRSVIADLTSSVGECRVALPYASMQMVRHEDGSTEWCCSHTPPHCSPA